MIERIKNLICAATDKDLAAYFDISPGVVSAWRRRGGNVPVEYCIKVAQDTGASLDYILLGKGYPFGTLAYTMPRFDDGVPQAERIRRMMDWHIEQLHQLTLLRAREEAKGQD